MSMRYKGGVISATAPTTSTSTAKGVWTITQQMQAVNASTWPATPGAPTIGTATAVTSSTATVTYTAPTNLGAGTVTFTATSSPGSYTGTGTSPITVSGLSATTSYTFTVTASTPGGTSPASAASNSITTPVAPPTVIGESYGGGYYAGQIGVSSVATHYIIVGPIASAQSASKKFKNVNSTVPGADSDIDGPQNTADMVADGNATVYPAAHFCNDLVIGGYSDWYFGAKNELEICYFNLKPDTRTNSTYGTSGINPNAVPARASIYTAGTPAQTSATIFRVGGAEAFADNVGRYWSSTEGGSTVGWGATFYRGKQDLYGMSASYYVRAIRRIAV